MSAADPVAHALAYPFDPPRRSFVFARGEGLLLAAWNGARPGESRLADGRALREVLSQAELDALAAPRAAVVACGSNGSPRRLREKFGDAAVTPTLSVRLDGYAVVHSAKIAGYGSIPATLHPEPGASCRVFVNLLTEDQLAVMDETETLGVAYDRPVLPRHAAQGLGPEVESLMAYVSRHGALAVDGAPAALSMVEQATRRRGLDQAGAQAAASGLVSGPPDPRAFVAENLADAGLRAERSRALREASALPFA